MTKWLNDAVFYEIYPQSFYDSNNDGIGDIQGIIQKLDYIKSLGCNALWINPCYDSPFKDAGYDVRDYKKVAKRYGTNEDLYELFEKAHQKDIHVLLDLVPGHTSEEHEWFKQSSMPLRNEYSDRYVWTNSVWQGIGGHPYIAGDCDRDGVYMLNFFKCQPALNYGFLNRTEDWQMAPDAPACMATRDALWDIMCFWLDHGCDGFRVDMADSLIKEDDEVKSATSALWADIMNRLSTNYPNAAMVSEWSNPSSALGLAHFDMDFYLDHHGNGYNTLIRDYETKGGDHSFFKCDGSGDIMRFLNDYLPKYNNTKGKGYISFITCNHDTPRPTASLSLQELKLAYSFFFSMPGVPFLYYGDEIGMKYIKNQKTKEGGFQRTGSRTPMQWANKKNLGFSEASSDKLYLPVDTDKEAPTVESCESDKDSLLHTVRNIIALRHSEDDLKADGNFEVVYAQKDTFPFVYKRGNLVIAVNPSQKEAKAPLNGNKISDAIYKIGDGQISTDEIILEPQSFIIFK